MLKIKKGDYIQVIKGKDRGKKAKILRIFRQEGRAIAEAINLAKKHKRRTQQDQKGGIVPIEMPISLSSLMLFCKGCNKPTRAGFMALKDGTKSRICKKCREVI